MILRSGLIQNFSHIDEAEFRRHWREVHGPLAAKLPNLKGYVQNHIVATGRVRRGDLMHRIDGISQLWFESVDLMSEGMNSGAQDACVADISSFLERVTLAIQAPGAWRSAAPGAFDPNIKLMAVYVGDGDSSALEEGVAAAIASAAFSPQRYRINFVVRRDFTVDPSVAHSEAPILAIVEAYFSDEEARRKVLESGALDSGRAEAAAVVAVTPYVFLSPPD
jgi:uncharacterized protein (TIGR02118 family)